MGLFVHGAPASNTGKNQLVYMSVGNVGIRHQSLPELSFRIQRNHLPCGFEQSGMLPARNMEQMRWGFSASWDLAVTELHGHGYTN
jgi:hypothetical protein